MTRFQLRNGFIVLGFCPLLVLSACSEPEEPAVGSVSQAVIEAPLSIRLPLDLDPRRIALAAGDELRINDGVTAAGLVVSSGTQMTNIGVAAVVGEVLSVPGVLLRNNAQVQGDVISGGAITLSQGAQADGVVSQNNDLGDPTEHLVTPPAGVSSGDVVLQPSENRVLEPGRYGTVSLAAGAVLRLSAGVYRFENLHVQPNATVSIDHEAGAVGVYVDEQITFSGIIETADISEHPQFALIALGTGDVHLNSAFVGALLAPRAKISLASVGGAGHRGQFIGRSIEAHQHQTIHYEPFEHWLSVWDSREDAPNEEQGDDLSDAFGDTPSDDAILRFIEAAFESDDEAEYAAARAGVLALPVEQVVGALTSAYNNLALEQRQFLVLFAAGVIQDDGLLPLYQGALGAAVPPEYIDPGRDPHDGIGGARAFSLSQVLRNLAKMHTVGIAGARSLLLDALGHPMLSVRSSAAFQIRLLAGFDPSLEAEMVSRLLPGDEHLANLEVGTKADFELPVPPPGELDPDFEPVPRGPSPGGTLPDCDNEVQDLGESDADCGGLCEPCPLGDTCSENADCLSNLCTSGTCVAGGSTPSDCIDLGSDGNNVTVPTNACLRVEDAYPSWWGTRVMQLQNTTPGTYPVPFSWSNDCAGTSGTGEYTGDWQNQFIGPTSSQCATIIQLGGPPSGAITLRYYGP